MNIKTICVLGGSGFVGRHIIHQLATSGYAVRVPTRNRERAKSLILLPPVDVIEADIHDETQLNRLFSGVDAVINLVGILHGGKAGHGDFQTVHADLTGKILKACAANGVRRLLHMSALNAASDGSSEYLRSKGAAEALIREATQSADKLPIKIHEGLQATIFRPSVIFGHEDAFLNLFAKLTQYLPIIFLGRANARFQPVFVEDVAQIFTRSLTHPDTYGRSYDVCGPKIYTLRQLVSYAAKVAGHARPVIGLGHTLAYFQAWIMEWLPGRLLSRDAFNSMQSDSVCQCDFESIFGFRPTAIEAVAPGYLARDSGRSRYRFLRRRAGR